MVLAHEFDGLLIDLDGVVYVGDRPLPGARDAIARLREMGKEVMFLTNDPRSSRRQYSCRLALMGIRADEEAILSAGFVTASFISRSPEVTATDIFVVGSLALKEEMITAGMTVLNDDAVEVDVVVVGGHSGFDYAELRAASRLIRQGAEFFATGRDATFPMPDGLWPGTGSVLAAVETASDRRACVIGKPEPHMFTAAQALLPECKRLAVVGDTLQSDIKGGRQAGLATVLVASSGPEPGESVSPDYTITSLRDLLE